MASTKGKGSTIRLEKDKPNNKCRKWQLRVSLGKNPRTGKYQTKVKTFHGSYREATAALRDFIDALENNRHNSRTDYTFKTYSERYLKDRELRKEVSPNTLLRQKWQVKASCRHIGEAKLESITGVMLNDMYAAMLNGDTLSGKKSGGSYVNKIHDCLILIFEAARKERLIAFNPCHDATPPKMDTRTKRALTPEQAHKFIAELKDPSPRHVAYLLAITMGLRRGEICGLSWNDIDFDNNLVNIRHSFDGLGNLKETKTKAGTRILPLPEKTKNMLLLHKEAQKAQFDKTNSFRKPHEGYIIIGEDFPVIAGQYGKRLSPGRLSGWWTKDRASFGLADWCLHEFRHTYLSLLAVNGVHPKVMQELAGHYSSQITMDIYTHVNMDQKRSAMEAVSKIF